MGIDRIRNTGNGLSLQQGTLPCLTGKPLAAGDEGEVLSLQHPLLLSPYLGGKVVGGTTSRQQTALLAMGLEIPAVEGQVTDGRGWPDVMHRPYYLFATLQYLADILQGEHPLVDPVQVDDIGFLELPQAGDVCPGIGNIDVKEVGTAQPQMKPYTASLP